MSTRSRPAPSAPGRIPHSARPRSPLTRVRTVLATLAAALVGVIGTLGVCGAPLAGASRDETHTSARLLLDDQTEWVVAPKVATTATSAPSVPFDLVLTARDAPAGATIEAVLYPRLRSRYALEAAVRGGPRGNPLTTSGPVAYDSLPADPHASGAVSFDLSVVQSSSTGRGTRLGLACAPAGTATAASTAASNGTGPGAGTCTGVYPVLVELRGPAGKILRHFTTFLTYVAGKSAHPLELAWVVPVDSSVDISKDPRAPSDGIAAPSAVDATALGALATQLRASAVPVTLDLSPETLQELDRAGPGGRAADAALTDLSADQSSDQVLASPYVPVDLGALAGAGESTEVAAQMAVGATVLAHFHVKATPGPSPWVQRGPVGSAIASGLAQVGATQLVLPEDDLAPTSDATDVGTWVSTFSLTLSHGGATTPVQAAETDTWLDWQFTSLRGNPALAATQILADLAMVHFERPNTAAARGMVALPPARWVPDPTFDRVLLDGLAQDPLVEPVTLSRFFGTVTNGGTRQLLTSGTGPALGHSFARSVSRARARLDNFDDAVAGHPAVLADLDDLLLATQAEDLTPRRRSAGVSTFDRLLREQIGLVSFTKGTTITLTARTGWIPVTIESRASYTVTGKLSVSGNKFVFLRQSNRRTVLVHLDHLANVSRVDVRARTSGDLPLDVTFRSPNGRLVIARGVLTVRSTATSLVGIVLTVVALAVLLVWWARTWRSGRRRRRSRRAEGPGGGAVAP